MKVKDLVKKLKKMPQDLEVGYRHGDNSQFEIAGWCEGVDHEVKKDFNPDNDPSADAGIIEDQPAEWVIISGKLNAHNHQRPTGLNHG